MILIKNYIFVPIFDQKCFLKLAVISKFLAILRQNIVAVSHPFFSCILPHSGHCIPEDRCQPPLFSREIIRYERQKDINILITMLSKVQILVFTLEMFYDLM